MVRVLVVESVRDNVFTPARSAVSDRVTVEFSTLFPFVPFQRTRALSVTDDGPSMFPMDAIFRNEIAFPKVVSVSQKNMSPEFVLPDSICRVTPFVLDPVNASDDRVQAPADAS